jgi:Ca2+-binding RTX toxin-like protein
MTTSRLRRTGQRFRRRRRRAGQTDYLTATFSITVDVGRGTADGLEIGHDLIAAFERSLGSGDDHIFAGSSSVSMTGGDGNDTFEFQREEEDDQHAMTIRRITDFTVGDRIVAATYEISYLHDEGSAADQLSDMFDDIYRGSVQRAGGTFPI